MIDGFGIPLTLWLSRKGQEAEIEVRVHMPAIPRTGEYVTHYFENEGEGEADEREYTVREVQYDALSGEITLYLEENGV